MATIGRETVALAIDRRSGIAGAWRAVADRTVAWCEGQGIALRDVVVLLPFVQLLGPARAAFASAGVWMPRIETTRTLAASLGPPEPSGAGAPTLDPALDRLQARQMLARQRWAEDWRRRDQRSFERGAARLVATCHALVAAASRVDPAQRDAWWDSAREAIRVAVGPAVRERALAQIALEWATLAPLAATDRLFECRPAAWIAVQAGGSDTLVTSLFAAARVPCLVIDTDVHRDTPFASVDDADPPSLAVCASVEDEAESAAAQVIEHLRHDQRPVALIAQDRVLVRRVRALLERAGAALLDETGWKLSTTRAAARLMGLLVASAREASADAFFDWLKSGTHWPLEQPAGVAALEAQCRRHAAWRLDAIAALTLDDPDPAAAAIRDAALAALRPLRDSSLHSLVAWLDLVGDALRRCGAWPTFQDDAAGQQLIGALGLDDAAALSRRATGGEPLSLTEFTQWVDETLEAATFRQGGSSTERTAFAEADVVITPLARAMLRPFAAAVLPGADDSRLGAPVADDELLSAATREAIGLTGRQALADRELLAFAQLLRLPHVTLLHRRADAGETLASSPLVERLSLSLAARQAGLRVWVDPRIDVPIVARATMRSAAVAPSLVPRRLSATSFEALRSCPYRFFARSMLALVEDAELDGDLEKRDYGNWLHHVLHLFHGGRASPRLHAVDAEAALRAADEAALRAAGASTLASFAFDAAEFLPWSASFEAFVPRYVTWLREREAGGARWRSGEIELRISPVQLEGVELHGRIDRIDERGHGAATTLELIDYKTGSAGGLQERVKDRGEDTQLAFYAALVGAGDKRPLRATYLALEARPELKEIDHRQVSESADALIEGIAIDLSRLRDGTGLLPMGEGVACEYCDVRGLCRRDHWSADSDTERDNDVAADGDPR